MSPPDAKPENEEEPQAEASEEDVESLLVLAKERRAAKDMKGCFEAYEKAARLGSADAEYAVALFFMNGSNAIPQDLKEGSMRLRAAAEKGSTPAKVYLGNLYELGIHYKADPEKADVWYRNAARAAKVEEAPGTDEHAMALAELGCARYVLAIVESGKVEDEAEKARLLARAKLHGYGLKVKDATAVAPVSADQSGDRATITDALIANERERKQTVPETKKAKEKEKAKSPSNAGAGLAAFGYALLFALAGVGAAYAATLGARELVAHGTTLPGLGDKADLVFPIVLGVVGVLPAWLVYKPSAFAKALLAGAAMGGIGWVAWGTGQAMHDHRPLQAIAFGLAGFLAALLVFGLLGGTKKGVSGRRGP